MINPEDSDLFQEWFGDWGDLIDTLIHDYVYEVYEESDDERTS